MKPGPRRIGPAVAAVVVVAAASAVVVDAAAVAADVDAPAAVAAAVVGADASLYRRTSFFKEGTFRCPLLFSSG
jgi:hypothetical protein